MRFLRRKLLQIAELSTIATKKLWIMNPKYLCKKSFHVSFM